MKIGQDFLDKVDPRLTFEESLTNKTFTDRFVYQVEKEGSFYVFKSFDETYEWGRKHIAGEVRVLEKVRGLDDITNLVRDYGSVHGRVSILKEYAKGKDLSEPDISLNDTRLQIRAEGVVRALHNLGFVELDVAGRNIVLSPDKKDITFIDLGLCKTREDLTDTEFEKERKADLRHLEYLME